MMLTADKKRKAIRLAYSIVTDKRNSDRYAFTAITNKETMERFGYNDMVETLEAMYREPDEGAEKSEGPEKAACVCKGPMKNRFFLGATPNWGVLVEKMPVHRYVLHVMYTTEHMALPIKYCPLCGAELDENEKED